jgi:wobble nucleotide-excising tRNase
VGLRIIGESTVITKITKLHGVGTLHAPLTSGAITFKKRVILYGENGRGKTTLVAILRSLATGDVSILQQRKSIKGMHPQVVQFLINQQPHELTNGQWSKTHPQIYIFDAAFVDNNVYTGATVDADHRKNLLSFALGEAGVRLARRVDGLAAEIAEQRKAEAEARNKVLPYIKGTMLPERFLRLDPAGENAQNELELKQRTRDGLQRASTLQQFQTLAPIGFEELSLSGLREVLGRTLASISREAELRMKAHLDRTHATERWIAEGMSFGSGDLCPYCAQDVRVSQIVPTYSDYFSAAYRDYRDSLKRDIDAVQQAYGGQKQANVRSTIEGNKSRLLQWKGFLPEIQLTFDINTTVAILEKARLALLAASSRKFANPLEGVALSEEEFAALAAVSAVATTVDDYNAMVVGINESIQNLRKAVQTGNPRQAEEDVAELENRIARHSVAATEACDAWANASVKRENLDTEKTKARKELDNYTIAILGKYKDAINGHLKKCGTFFRINTLKTTYTGGTPRCEYGIELFGEPVDLASKPASQIAFDSALSQGDKNALAFAFFLARLESDTNRANQIVIFDDPLSSLDSVRRRYTRLKIAEIAAEVSQLIVLTHEETTVADISERLGESECSLFALQPHGDFSEITPTSVKQLTATEYAKNFGVLAHFIHHQRDPENVVTKVRPYLEANLRYRFPDEFKADPLGKMISQIRSEQVGRPLARLVPLLSDLGEINEFCTKYSHGDGALVNAERLLPTDVRRIVEMALDVSRGFPASAAIEQD